MSFDRESATRLELEPAPPRAARAPTAMRSVRQLPAPRDILGIYPNRSNSSCHCGACFMPVWLTALSIASLAIGFICAIGIAISVARHPQHMWIMNIVWPVTALFGTFVVVWAYRRYGKLATRETVMRAKEQVEDPPSQRLTPFPMMVVKGACHCGSGCTLADISSEWLGVAAPIIATWFGWKTIFHEKIFAMWFVDYLFALAFGIAFQYFTIKPMRDLSVKEGLVQAFKADVASLTAWQVGMYGFMAFAHFFVFGELLGEKLRTSTVEFWFMMQIAMIFGFLTSYPVNWWLIRKGVKEKM